MILVCIGAIFTFAYIFSIRGSKRGRIYFIVASGLILFLYAALRGVLPGTDMMGYIRRYNLYSTYSFEQIVSIFESEVKNPTFHMLGWGLSKIGFTHAQWWIAIIAGAYLIPTMIIIYKESPHPLISMVMFLALGFFTFSLTGLRQTVAMSLIYLSYFYLRDRKLSRFIILVLIAALFHASALLFLIAYPLSQRKLGIVQTLIFVASLLAIILFENAIRNLMVISLEDSYLAGYAERETGLNLVGFFVQGGMFLISLIYYSSTIKKYPNAIIFYNLALIGLIFQFSSTMIAELFRVSMYFSFFNIILLPMAISTEQKNEVKLIEEIGCIMLLLIYMLRKGIPEYIFFWQ